MCVFHQEKYIDLLELLIQSLSVKGNIQKDTTDILILTSPDFLPKVQTAVSKYDLPIKYYLLNLTTMMEASCCKLNIYDYDGVAKYDKILYLDADILIMNDINTLFMCEIEKEKLYVLEEGTLGGKHWGREFFDFTKYDPNTPAFCAGVFYFLNTPAIKSLLDHTRNHIYSYMHDEKNTAPICLDQPFLVYNSVSQGKYNNQLMKSFMLNIFYDNSLENVPTDKVIYHFLGGHGFYAPKYSIMSRFWNMDHKNICAKYICSHIIGKKYTFDIGYISYTGLNTINTAWGAGTFDVVDSQNIIATSNNYQHAITFNFDFTFFISKRIHPCDNEHINGTLYIESLPLQPSTHWVSCKLVGGIGNRIFEIVAACGVAEKLHRPVVFYDIEVTKYSHQGIRNIYYLFPHIPIVHGTHTVKDIHEEKVRPYKYAVNAVNVQDTESNILIHGCRQNINNFPSYQITPSFDMFLTKEKEEELLTKYKVKTIEEKVNTWFIHVRLGDYKLYKELSHITVESYHRHLLKHIPENANILLFSNEIDTAVSLLQTYMNRPYLPCVEQNECISLFLMKQCWGGAIVPNSTFSWWGSYFAYTSSLYKSIYRAYYPEDWFHDDKESGPAFTPPWGIRYISGISDNHI